MERYSDDVIKVEAQQFAGVSFVYGNLEVVAYAKQAKLFSFGHFVVVPAEVADRLAPLEVQAEVSVPLDFSEKIFRDVGNDILKWVDIDDASTDDVFVDNRT